MHTCFAYLLFKVTYFYERVGSNEYLLLSGSRNLACVIPGRPARVPINHIKNLNIFAVIAPSVVHNIEVPFVGYS